MDPANAKWKKLLVKPILKYQTMNKKDERRRDTASKKNLRNGTGNFETVNGKKKSPQFKDETEDKNNK